MYYYYYCIRDGDKKIYFEKLLKLFEYCSIEKTNE
jgi:hypothetical protein